MSELRCSFEKLHQISFTFSIFTRGYVRPEASVLTMQNYKEKGYEG